VQERLKDGEQALAALAGSAALTADEIQHIKGHIAAISAYQALYSEQLDRVRELGGLALELLPEDNFMRSSVALALGWAERFNGDLKAATKAFLEARNISLRYGNTFLAVSAVCRLAYTQMLAGQLQKAADTCLEALQMAAVPQPGGDAGADQRSGQLPVAGYALVYLGTIYGEWNRLEEAVSTLERGIDLCSQLGYIMDQIVGQSALARAKIGQGECVAAKEACDNANEFSQKMKGYIYAQRWAEDCQVRLWLAQCDEDRDRLVKATRWAEQSGLQKDDELNFYHELAHIMLARVLVAQGEADPDGAYLADAHYLLERLLETAESAGWMGKAIEILVLQALAYQAQDRLEEALCVLEQALTLAEPEGYIRIFLDEGQAMARLLYKAAERQISSEYAGRLLAAFPAREPIQNQQVEMVDPLSEREMEVMQLISEGDTNAEIAQSLHITTGTVKNHIKNIYSKLNVHNRAQAIARARQLGLIE
jgi:LuxR family maltose regulon positive regulatory protein